MLRVLKKTYTQLNFMILCLFWKIVLFGLTPWKTCSYAQMYIQIDRYGYGYIYIYIYFKYKALKY